jgi:aminotransferase
MTRLSKQIDDVDFLSWAKPTSFCKRLLREAHVSTIPGVALGPTGESHMRLSFCVPEDRINIAFDRIERFIQGE